MRATCAHAAAAAGGQAGLGRGRGRGRGEASRQVGGERAGVAWLGFATHLIAGVSTLLHYGECGLALIP
jgi:hypothetical protein